VYTLQIGVTVAVYTSVGCSSALRMEMNLGFGPMCQCSGPIDVGRVNKSVRMCHGLP